MDQRDVPAPQDPRAPRAPLRNDVVTIGCPVCGQRFVPRGRQRVCSSACRQARWRQRQRAVSVLPGAPLRPAQSPRSVTVYECPSCETRYVGEQRCPDCHRFCRRVGPGGACPHCDEPVALTELLPALPVLAPPPKGGGSHTQ